MKNQNKIKGINIYIKLKMTGQIQINIHFPKTLIWHFGFHVSWKYIQYNNTLFQLET